MRRLFPPSMLAGLLLLSGCGDSDPPESGSGGSAPDTITGTERLGWLQPLENPGDVTRYQYALYVDGERRLLPGASCRSTADGADCSAPLPSLAAGRHTLEVAAFFTTGNDSVEGPRSSPLQVNVAAALGQVPPATVTDGPLLSSDGLRLHAEVLADDLVDPIDLAVTAHGRVFVAQRNGVVRTFDAGAAVASPLADNVLELFPDAGVSPHAALLSIGAPPEHADTAHLHLLYASVDRDEPVVRLARVRELRGAFGEAAVLRSFSVRGADAAATLRFGPDGKLYVGLGSVEGSEDAQNLSAPSGKILRLDPDGRTPDDNPAASPVLTLGHRDPRGLAWLGGALWEVERGESGDELNRIRPQANYGWPVRGETRAALAAPALSLGAWDVSGVAAPDPPSALHGDLVVSARLGEDLFRVRVGQDGSARVVSRLLQRRFGRIAQVAAAGGALYFITANGMADGAGRDALVRLTTTPRSSSDARGGVP